MLTVSKLVEYLLTNNRELKRFSRNYIEHAAEKSIVQRFDGTLIIRGESLVGGGGGGGVGSQYIQMIVVVEREMRKNRSYGSLVSTCGKSETAGYWCRFEE